MAKSGFWNRTSLTTKILYGMGLGLGVGLVLKSMGPNPWIEGWLISGVLDTGGRIFVALLKLLVAPLVFVSLVVGTASLDDVRKLGRVGFKTLAIYLSTTAVAIIFAIIFAVLVRPGDGMNLKSDIAYQTKEPPPISDIIVNIIPSNPFQSLVQGEMLQIIFFAIFFGLAITLLKPKDTRLLPAFQSLDAVIMQMVVMTVHIAPIGVFFLMAKVFATQGFQAILPLGKYFFLVLLVLLIHATVTYSVLLKVFANLSPFTFFRKFKGVLAFAFSTSSSNATIPVTLENVTSRLGVSNSIASFSIPLGATINMDGTAIMQGVAAIFISQVYGIDIGFTGMVMIVLTATLASIGTAGVPGVGLITLAMVLRQVNLPVEGIALIIGVDRLLDMARTAVNVTGDAVTACVVAKSENQLDLKVFNSSDEKKSLDLV